MPGYIPRGYRMMAANGIDQQRHVMPDGSVSYTPVAAYSTLCVTYLNPTTGNAIVLYESADRLDMDDGQDLSQQGFSGRVATYGKPFPYVKASWQRDGCHFLMSASHLSEQEAVRIAGSMSLLSRAASAQTTTRMPRSGVTASRLEFRYLRSVKSRKRPNVGYDMSLVRDSAGGAVCSFHDSGGRRVDPKRVIAESPLILSGADLEPVTTCFTDSGNRVQGVRLQFTPKGTRRLADFTRAHQGEFLAIVVDGRIVSAPCISVPIIDGQATITGVFNSADEAQDLADALNRR